ncbi:VWA domain-containing protein [Leptotrichia sp. HSP-536]|uniref:VWA domain-containing protein n=1 Tax=Leptotrichia alba TaxID=3239304 RepID=A0AB39V5L3_9FUSO
MEDIENLNKWRLILGNFAQNNISLDPQYSDMDSVLDFLYSREYSEEKGIRKEDSNETSKMGGRGGSSLTVPQWIGKVRRLFPKETVEIMQKQAISKYNLTELLTDEKILKDMQPDMELLKNILMFKNMMSSQVLRTAKKIIGEVVNDIEKQLKKEIIETFYGKKNPYKSSPIRTMKNFDLKKTVRRNLKNYDVQNKVLVPSRLYFSSRIKKQNEYSIIIAVDQSGSMISSVIYSAVMAGIFSSLSMFDTKLIVFDTSIVDLSDYVASPVEILLSVQLGGGTDISRALDYAITKIMQPQKTIVVLVSDLYDGYSYGQMYRRISDIVEGGSKMFVLPALDYDACGSYDKNAAAKMASLGADVAAITPKELAQWIAKIVL